MTTTALSYQIEHDGSQHRLAVRSRTLPDLGSKDVLVKVYAAALNFRDLLVLGGQIGPLRQGLVPLSDAAGTVVKVGADVTRWKVGDRVAPGFFSQWKGGPCKREYLAGALGGGQTDGVLSDKIVAREDALTALPEHLSFTEAATLPCAGVAAWHALFARGHLQAGETVLVQGTGGVALFALQLAVARGARVIITSSSDQKLERARALGAWQTINYKTHPAWHEEVLRITAGQGADHVLELGGPATYEQSIAATAVGGRIAQVGVLTGAVSRPNLLPLQLNNLSIDGICVGSLAHFAELNAFVSQHRIKPVVDRTFSFDDAPAAYDYLKSGSHFGKVVINL